MGARRNLHLRAKVVQRGPAARRDPIRHRPSYMSQEKDRLAGRQNLAAVDGGEEPLSALIARTANADARALAALYDGTAAHVHGVAMRILQDDGAAEEVTIDVYRQVWREAGRYDPERGRPLAWLLMLARSRAIDRRRSAALERARTESLADGMPLPCGAPTPEESCALDERRRVVQGALARLAAEQRQVIELAYFGGLSQSEIATHLGEPLGTVKTRIRIGMVRLRDALGSAGRAVL